MSLFGGIIVFVIAWWISFLAVLPIGADSQAETGNIVEGTEEGAPVNPQLKKKVIWATIGAAIITVVAGVIITLVLAE